MESCQSDIECSSSWNRDCIDAIKGHPLGIDAQKPKKFFRLREKKDWRLYRQDINSQTYSDLVDKAFYRPKGDVCNQNSYGCDARHGSD